MNELYVGVDVSKDRLDVVLSDGRAEQFSNDEAGHDRLIELLQGGAPQVIVMEATGGLERALAVQLAAAAASSVPT